MEIMEDFPVDVDWKMPQLEAHVTINRRERSKMDASKTLKGASSLGFLAPFRRIEPVCPVCAPINRLQIGTPHYVLFPLLSICQQTVSSIAW